MTTTPKKTSTSAASLYREMDQATLEHQYNARASVSSFDDEMKACEQESASVQQRMPSFETVVYDQVSGEKLDLYGAAPGRPVFLWIHGGYWRVGSRHDNAYAAGGLLAHDVAVAVMDYTLAPTASLDEMVRQVRAAVIWLHRYGADRGLLTDRIHVGGSSAGGHLVGMLLAKEWHTEFGLDHQPIGVALALSGLYELDPLPHTQVNQWMHFTPEVIAKNSPINLIPTQSQAHLIASVGGYETDEFRRQTEAYAQLWQQAGNRLDIVEMPTHNHFNIARSMSEPQGKLVLAILQALKSVPTPKA